MTRKGSFGGALALSYLLASCPSIARQAGTDEPDCLGCHETGTPPQGLLTVDRQQIAPGKTVSIALDVVSENLLSGFLATAPAGEFSFPDAEFQRAERPNLITHVKPKPFVDGALEWRFEWTAPASTGVTIIEASTVAANGNEEPDDDGALLLKTWVSHGCEAVEYFPDLDEDGYGDADGTVVPSCTPVAGYVANGRDCADDDPVRNPDAEELCNAVDDNCDGRADEGLNTTILYPDLDGDGYGSADAFDVVLGCPPLSGYADNADDCNDDDPGINRGAADVCNGVDDDCDGVVDEDCVALEESTPLATDPTSDAPDGAGPTAVAPSAGVMQPATAPSVGGASPAAPPTAQEPSRAASQIPPDAAPNSSKSATGCRFSAGQPVRGCRGVPFLLMLGLIRRRRTCVPD